MHFASTHPEPLMGIRPVRSSRPALSRRSVAVGGLAILLLAGCSNSGSEATSTEGAASGGTSLQDGAARNSAPDAKTDPGANGAYDANSAPGAKAVPGAPAVPPGAADVAKPGAPVPGVGPKLTRSASLDLQVKDIAVAAARVRSIATGVQAQVLTEQIGKGNPGDPIPLQDDGVTRQDGSAPSKDAGTFSGFGTLTLSVPADKLDIALEQLSKQVGTVLRRNASSQDVTSQYVDTESRLKTMRASVDRVRALMAQAKDLGQVVALESEMSRRQADLESLESQLAALKSSVERSTLAVSLSTATPGIEPVTNNGFLGGLRAGWDAFTASAEELLKVIGAVLPFAVFFALLGAPFVVWLRRRQANHPLPTPAPAATA
jgi:Domain of unknown function (DUF4349)